LNQWTEQQTRFISLDVWDENGGVVSEDSLFGMECYGGLDLASTTDVAALALVFPDDGQIVMRFWIPEDNMRRRVDRDRVPYDQWVRDGWITATPGNVIDYDRIRADVSELGKQFNIKELAIDRWNATQITTQLDGDGFTVVPFGQGFASMSAPTKELEKLLVGRELNHGDNPVLRWMASNVAVKEDAAGNLKPAKDKSSEKIDGIVALVMGLGRAAVRNDSSSVYEDRGVLVL
jgi:phage terminase large subunit-like protein